MPGAFRTSRRVQFSETDMAGVMHFSNYLRWAEDVEHAFWRTQGLSVHFERGGSVVSWPRVAATCEYFAPARFDDEIELELSVAKVGVKSVTFVVEFRKNAGAIARATITAVCCRTGPGRFEPIPTPPEIRAALEGSAARRAK